MDSNPKPVLVVWRSEKDGPAVCLCTCTTSVVAMQCMRALLACHSIRNCVCFTEEYHHMHDCKPAHRNRKCMMHDEEGVAPHDACAHIGVTLVSIELMTAKLKGYIGEGTLQERDTYFNAMDWLAVQQRDNP